MKITACPLCGSKNVGMGGIRDGVHPQEFLKQACKNCGWTGTPLEFDTDPFLTLLPITLNRIFVNFNHHSN